MFNKDNGHEVKMEPGPDHITFICTAYCSVFNMVEVAPHNIQYNKIKTIKAVPHTNPWAPCKYKLIKQDQCSI